MTRGSAPPAQNQAAGRAQAGLLRPGIMAALGSLFNVLALNLVLLIASLPLVTLPVAVNAATVALDRWRRDGEDRVVREFCAALRSAPPLRTTALVGVPLAAAGLGVAEIRFFLHAGTIAGHVGLGLGLAALLITTTALGYVFLLAARYPSVPAADLCSLSARLAVRNLLLTGPLFLIEIAAALAAALADPPLLLLGLPVALLYLMKLTAHLGLRRAGLKQP